MIETDEKREEAPVWGRPEAFPEAPQGWGWVGVKNEPHRCNSLEELHTAIRNDPDGGVLLAWTPEHHYMVLPEEIPGSGDAVRAARKVWTRLELEEGNRKLRWYGLGFLIFALYTFHQNWQHVTYVQGENSALSETLKLTRDSSLLGLALLLFIIFGLIPWYSAFKRRKELDRWTEEKIAATVPSIRFETWLERQKAPITYVMLGLIGIVYVFQLLRSGDHGIQAAGLLKSKEDTETWRLLTAPFLHGNIVHLLMNGSAMLYLGKRMEVFSRWPHVPMVFLFAAYIGGETSLHFLGDIPGVGASGGLMGWLGFLLIFETLHAGLVPRHARRRLLAGVFLTAFIGLIGYRFIDNAAHAGGLIAGMLYAVIVFPKSTSVVRPRATITDRIGGSLALLLLIGAAGFTISRLLNY